MIKTISIGVISAMIILTASIIPSVAVQAQTTPWQLFGQICQYTSPISPQCQQLLQQQQLAAAQQAQQTNNLSACPSGYYLSGNQCLPLSSTTCTQTSTTLTQPTSNAGAAQTVGSGVSVTLSGASSTCGTVLESCVGGVSGSTTTLQNTVVSYAWTQVGTGNRVMLNQPNTISPTFTAPTTTNTTILTFQLIVSDSNRQVSAPATTQVTVS